jgi:hypothetical protein
MESLSFRIYQNNLRKQNEICKMKQGFYLCLIACISCKTEIKYPAGGYDYPKNIAAKDSNLYFYPLKDIEPKRDAFRSSYDYLVYRPFDEPNLSIKPQEKTTLRFSFFDKPDPIIIVINEDSITIKTGDVASIYDTDSSQLSETEKFHLEILERRYPIDQPVKNLFLKSYLDSLAKRYPQLLDVNYYHKLYEKSYRRNENIFKYSIKKIGISRLQFYKLIEHINTLGFWKLPYRIECVEIMTDDFAYFLELNTPNQYKIVKAVGCPDETTNFLKLCEKIVQQAGMQKQIHLRFDGAVDSMKLQY